MTIQDLIHLKFPEYRRNVIRRTYVRTMFARALTSDRIIVPSESTKNDLIRELKADGDRIRVTPYAADPVFRPRPLAAAASTAAAYGLSSNFLIYVGLGKAHKNIGALITVFAQLLADGSWDGQLAIVGSGDQRELRSELSRSGLDQKVVLTGFVPDADLSSLYSAATALVHPSLYEGFGFTVLEAMACGLPVVALRTTSIPEVAGDAALLVSDDDVDLYKAVRSVVQDASLRRRLSSAGLVQAGKFSWDRTAGATLAVYDEL